MKPSTRARYGLRAMVNLAANFGNKSVLAASIAKNEGISIKYLHTLLTLLKTQDLVRSIRGAGGGFVLAKPPSDISINDIVRALEGSLSLVECLEDNVSCERMKGCIARDVWKHLSENIELSLANITLEDLVRKKREKEHSLIMFHI